ncbi:MAG: signal peptidase II [Clostridia bacterium]|nr:signal peptidase II [Clostridia bacterium]
MKQKTALRAILLALIVLALLAVDLITKHIAEANAFHQSTYFLGLVRLNFVKNTGIAYGLFSDSKVGMLVITVLTIVEIVAIPAVAFTLLKGNFPAQITLAVIESGAIGNLVDRLALSYVRDFIDIAPMGFGVCNIADFCITLGAVALVIIILFVGPTAIFPLKKEWREEAKRREQEAENGEA